MSSLLPETIAYGATFVAWVALAALLAVDMLRSDVHPRAGRLLFGPLVVAVTVSSAGIFVAALLRLLNMDVLTPKMAAGIRIGISSGLFGALVPVYIWRFR